MVAEDILIEFNAELISLEKGEVIFEELERPHYFFQIKKGKIAMNTLNEDGKQFTQGVFSDAESFGEPPLFIDKLYPSTAITLEKTEIYQLPKDAFMALLIKYPMYSLELNKKLSELLYFKSTMAKEISLYDPEHRIITLFKFLKTSEDARPQMVELTRQQIANLTALRVETVIRAIKSLEVKGELIIKNRKVYF